jgi:transposase InsO family protein
MQECNDSSLAGHCGWKKVLHALQQWYYWDTMAKDVKVFIQGCPHCKWYKPTVQPVPPIMPKLVPQRPFSEISFDWVGPLPVSYKKHDSLLNIVDSFTKFALCIPVTRSMTTKQLVDTLWASLFTLVGLPSKIIGDRATRLTADAMRALCKQLHIRLSLSAAYRPQTDGQTERFNRTFMRLLRATTSQHKGDWEQQLPTVVYAPEHIFNNFSP